MARSQSLPSRFEAGAAIGWAAPWSFIAIRGPGEPAWDLIGLLPWWLVAVPIFASIVWGSYYAALTGRAWQKYRNRGTRGR